MTNTTRQIILCECSNGSILPEATRNRVIASLGALGDSVTTLPDLCGSAACRDEALLQATSAQNLVFVACFPRAVRWLLASAGIPMESKTVEFLNMRTQSADEILKALHAPPVETTAATTAPRESEWAPWYPVIDYEKCVHCRQCMDFCLFGVYDVDEDGKIRVVHPANCKNNCPACARICPHAAIIFPKFRDPPINGAEVDPNDKTQAKVKVDIDEMLGEDLYAALARRKRAKKKLLRDKQALSLAEKERTNCSRDCGLADTMECEKNRTP